MISTSRSALLCFIFVTIFSSCLCSVSLEVRVLNSQANIDFLQFQVPFSSEETVIEANNSKIIGSFEVEEDAVFMVRALIRGIRTHVSKRVRVSMKNVNVNWQTMKVNFEPEVAVELLYRLPCPTDMYGYYCEVFCTASDDDFNGHFECGKNGEKICIDGFRGKNCTESIHINNSAYGFMDIQKFLLYLTIFLLGATAYAIIILIIGCILHKSEKQKEYFDFYPPSTNFTSVSEMSETYYEILDCPFPISLPYAPVKTPELPKSECPSTPPFLKEESLDKSIIV